MKLSAFVDLYSSYRCTSTKRHVYPYTRDDGRPPLPAVGHFCTLKEGLAIHVAHTNSKTAPITQDKYNSTPRKMWHDSFPNEHSSHILVYNQTHSHQAKKYVLPQTSFLHNTCHAYQHLRHAFKILLFVDYSLRKQELV